MGLYGSHNGDRCIFVTHAPLVDELSSLAPVPGPPNAWAWVRVPSTPHGQSLAERERDRAVTAIQRWPQRSLERAAVLAACRQADANVLVCNLFCLDVLAIAEAAAVPAVVVSPFWQDEPCPAALLAGLRAELPELAALLDHSRFYSTQRGAEQRVV